MEIQSLIRGDIQSEANGISYKAILELVFELLHFNWGGKVNSISSLLGVEDH